VTVKFMAHNRYSYLSATIQHLTEQIFRAPKEERTKAFLQQVFDD